MIKNPIPKVTNKLQYRAIGIINGIYKPQNANEINKGILIDSNGKEIETVVLGKALSLIRKYINLKNSHYWIVYPKNKNTKNLHLQILGIWDPYHLNDIKNEDSKNATELLDKLNLTDNYFSIRGEIVFINIQKKEFVVKIRSSSKVKKSKNSNFKLIIEGELSLEFLNNFVSLDVIRDGSTLRMLKVDVIEKSFSNKK